MRTVVYTFRRRIQRSRIGAANRSGIHFFVVVDSKLFDKTELRCFVQFFILIIVAGCHRVFSKYISIALHGACQKGYTKHT